MTKRILTMALTVLGVAATTHAAQLVHFDAEDLALGVATNGQVMLDGAAAGGANNGNLYSGMEVVTGGVNGSQALKFNGSTTQVQINYPQYGGMSGMQNNGAVSFWYHIPTGAALGKPIVGMSHLVGGDYENYTMFIYSDPYNSNVLRAGTANGNPGEYAFITGGAMVLDNWTHVLFTWEAGAEQLYVNGGLVASSSTQTPVLNAAFLDNNIVFGMYGGLGGAFEGLLDEIALYDNHLSQADVTALYDSYIPEPASLALLGLGGLVSMLRRRA